MTLLPSHGTKSFLSACLIAGSIILPHAALAETIGLQDALRKTIAVAPERLASSATVRATQASIDQAGQRPLPELSLEADNFPAIGGDRIGTRLETTLSYAQRIEMGGKRAARIKVAEGETLASKAQRTVDMLDLFLTVETAWVEALAADADLALAKQKLKISRSIVSELKSRVEAGRDPKFIAARGTADANAARSEYERAQSEARARASELASFWGVGAARVTLDPADFVDLKRTPSAAGVSPDEAVYTARSRTARAKFSLEQSNNAQDLNVSVGVRYFNNDRDAALVFGLSIPLGGTSANRGNIEQARNNAIASEQTAIAAANMRARHITRLQSSLQAGIAQATRMQSDVIPQAKSALDLARQGFRRGAFTYLDVIEAERSLIEANASLNAIRKQFHLDNALLARLTAQHIGLVDAVEAAP
ncbi:MAG: TolC family protein [Parvibaculum sp.]